MPKRGLVLPNLLRTGAPGYATPTERKLFGGSTKKFWGFSKKMSRKAHEVKRRRKGHR